MKIPYHLLLTSLAAHGLLLPVSAANEEEFVVFDSNQIAKTGVAPNPSYSERNYSSAEIVSVPGCPKSINGFPWVLYYGDGDTSGPKCYLVGESPSVCQGLTMHYQPNNSSYGLCQCDFQYCLDKGGETFHGDSSDNYRFCTPSGWQCLELVYFEAEGRCYDLYSKGPCNDTEWLEPTGQGEARCASRKCPDGKRLDKDTEQELEDAGGTLDDGVKIGCCEPSGSGKYSSADSVSKVACGGGKVWNDGKKECVRGFSGKLSVG